MKTKVLMVSSALFMAICGVLFQFAPHSVLSYFNADSDGILPVLVQIIGALFLGFAMMNWMAKAVLIGGIYADFKLNENSYYVNSFGIDYLTGVLGTFNALGRAVTRTHLCVINAGSLQIASGSLRDVCVNLQTDDVLRPVAEQSCHVA